MEKKYEFSYWQLYKKWGVFCIILGIVIGGLFAIGMSGFAEDYMAVMIFFLMFFMLFGMSFGVTGLMMLVYPKLKVSFDYAGTLKSIEGKSYNKSFYISANHILNIKEINENKIIVYKKNETTTLRGEGISKDIKKAYELFINKRKNADAIYKNEKLKSDFNFKKIFDKFGEYKIYSSYKELSFKAKNQDDKYFYGLFMSSNVYPEYIYLSSYFNCDREEDIYKLDSEKFYPIDIIRYCKKKPNNITIDNTKGTITNTIIYGISGADGVVAANMPKTYYFNDYYLYTNIPGLEMLKIEEFKAGTAKIFNLIIDRKSVEVHLDNNKEELLDDDMKKILNFKKLYDAGAITIEEYETKKKDIMNKM